MLEKSLRLYPLPGVDALYQHAKNQLLREEDPPPRQNDAQTRTTPSSSASSTNRNTNQNGTSTHNTNRATSSAAPHLNRSASMGADGREYTSDQVQAVQNVLKAQKGGRGAHYRVLNISTTATESEIKVRQCVCMINCFMLCYSTRFSGGEATNLGFLPQACALFSIVSKKNMNTRLLNGYRYSASLIWHIIITIQQQNRKLTAKFR